MKECKDNNNFVRLSNNEALIRPCQDKKYVSCHCKQL